MAASIAFDITGKPVAKVRKKSSMLKATDEQLIEAYVRTGSCHMVAKEFGMCHQSVNERINRFGIGRGVNKFSEADKEILRAEYQNHAGSGTLDLLAKKMGRTKHFICRQAGMLGLTDKFRARPFISEICSKNTKEMIRTKGHPRGMAGKRHTEATKQIISKTSSDRWDEMTDQERSAHVLKSVMTRSKNGTLYRDRDNTSWKAGWRVVGGRRIYFRSRWEANYGRYLEWLKQHNQIIEWEHEPETFWFDGVRRGAVSYLPDFRVTENNGKIAFHEVKGWMDQRSKTKLKRMKKYHPTVTVLLVDSKAYRAIARKVKTMISGWE